MNTTQLECFVQVAKTLNFIRAAEQLNLSQPALSKQIMSLENELGVKLLERTTRSVRLTAAGQRFLPDAEFILEQINDSKQRVHTYQSERTPTLRIGYSDAHELQRITPAVTQLRSELETMAPVFTLGKRDANLDLLQDGKLDLVLALKDDLRVRGEIGFQPLFTEQLYCAVPPDHPLAAQEMTDVRTVRHYPQVLCIPYNPVITVQTSSFLRSVPLNAEGMVTMCASASEAYALTLAGMGAAILPKHLIVPFPKIRLVPILDSDVQTYGVYYSQSRKTELVERFLPAAVEVFQDSTELDALWPEEFRKQLLS